ncbi:GNAT family protein [Vibrio sp. SCSIO 43136]|uniref:GNAT family N-acetyltransferase n=1 Tax=Vibrio sp. SCSIO 43136 TaxID=2819101 RepID=UPI0020756F82|nr:GNAT family protein [Vibrio sp. SCSIO 43136]USD64029.1 GNAT family N-acetyltransferase [Vibrio sp. SCSIO 43136]
MSVRVSIRPAKLEELASIHRLITSHDEWTKFNGPYFPYQHPTLEEFEQTKFQKLLAGDEMQLILCDGNPVGSVSFYWECEQTRWLEAGVAIYDANHWSGGIGRRALSLWITYLFDTQDIARVGLTTWSGNPRMMACAEKLGLTLEARLRKVRYFQGEYYDSVKYGVLREEWFAQKG